MQLNKLLQRQVLKYIGNDIEIPENFVTLLHVISESYNHYEKDRYMLERSIDLSSKELIELNVQLKADILEREKTEKELIKTNQKLTYHLNNTPLAVIEWDRNLNVTYWNEKAEEIFGWKNNEALGKSSTSLNIVYHEDIDLVNRLSENLVNGIVNNNFLENRNYNKAGEILDCEWYNSVLKDEHGNVTTILSLVRNITHRTKIERELKTLNKDMKMLFENIDETLFSVDMVNYKIIQMSPACEKIYGYSAEEFYTRGNLWYEVIHPEDKKIADVQLETLRSGQTVFNQYRIIHRDGSIRFIENKVIPTLDPSGQLIRIDGLSNDVTAKILHDRELKESNERYEMVTKATNDAIWDWNLETNELYWSDGYEKLFGYKTLDKEQNSIIWTSRIHEEDKKRVEKGIKEKINNSHAGFWEDEYRYYRADGSIAQIYDRAFVVYNDHQKPIRMVGAMQDISLRKEAEDHLQKSEANLRNIFENTDTSYVLLDEKANILSYNKLATILAREENMGDIEEGKNYIDLMPEYRRAEVRNVLENVLERGKKLSYEVRYDRDDKTYTWLYVSMHPIFNINHKILGLSVAATNITARKKAEESLLKSEANLRTIFDNTSIAYVLLDKKFKVISYNEAAARGYKKELKFDLIEGISLLDHFPCDKKRLTRKGHEALLSGKKINYEMSFGDRGESRTWYYINMFPVFDSLNNTLGFIISSEDITIRKNAELEREKITSDLIQRNKDLHQFAYIISHNLRSPVANIIGLSSIITDNLPINKTEHKTLINGLSVSARKLDEVIRDLNHILQVRHEINEKKELVKFSDVTADIQTSIGTLITKENVIIKTDFSDVDDVFTLKSYMNSIFYNLISNSIKYRSTENQPWIEIRSKKINNKIHILFKDNGIGIDLKNNEDKIFGLYKKFHAHKEGKGIGLYMVKTQVEILGGKIGVKSEVNKGAEFLIELDS
jgi:PAS domain S-box-containing protein